MNRGEATRYADALHPLARRAFASWHRARTLIPASVVWPSVPILFFGDAVAYRSSPVRILTVGLNPSCAEFPDSDPFQRFPAARDLREVDSCDNFVAYVEGLSSYFHVGQQPYRNWFSCYEPMLNGMGASYYAGAISTALHTDICSPVATDPTWSRLAGSHRGALIRDGHGIWHDLVRVLQPHVILASVAKRHVDNIAFPADPWSELHRVERSNPYLVLTRTLTVESGSRPLLVFGRAAQKPFSLITDAEKRLVGRKIAEGREHG